MITANTSMPASDSIGGVNSNPCKYVPAGTGPAYWGPGDQIRFLFTGEQTGGAYFYGVRDCSPRAPCRHREHLEGDYSSQPRPAAAELDTFCKVSANGL